MSVHFPNQVLGYHGCDRDVGEQVLAGKTTLRASNRSYDWLGHGIYFWENNPARALHWAKQEHQRRPKKVRHPFAIGAIIDLGNCLNLLEQKNLELLRDSHKDLVDFHKLSDVPLPENKTIGGGTELLLRHLDCAVVQWLHKLMAETHQAPFDSARGMFPEGKPLYTNAGFSDRNHIQLAIINPKNIIGYFRVGDMGE